MQARCLPLVLALSLGAALPAHAQGAGGLAACMGLADDTARLACFDREAALAFPERRAEADSARQTARQEARAAAERRAAQAFGARAADEPAERVDRLETRLVEVLDGRDRRHVFVLENGQLWRITEAQLVPPVRAGDAVVVQRGSLGSFRLSLPRLGRAFPVQRMR